MKKMIFMLIAATLILGAGEVNLNRMGVYPGKYKSCWQNRVLTRTVDMKDVCVYNWISMQNGGALILKLEYRLDKGTVANVALAFRKKNGKPGDAGKIRFKLPEGTGEVAKIEFRADIPKLSHDAQIIVSLPSGKAEIELMKISFDFAENQKCLGNWWRGPAGTTEQCRGG